MLVHPPKILARLLLFDPVRQDCQRKILLERIIGTNMHSEIVHAAHVTVHHKAHGERNFLAGL